MVTDRQIGHYISRSVKSNGKKMERATNRTQGFPLTNTKTVDTKLRREQQIVDNFFWETYAVYLRRPFCSDAILFLRPADRPLPRSSR